MSSPSVPPDPELDALLAQGEALRQRYDRSTAAEAPSADTDARIRAAAWKAVGAVPKAGGRSWVARLRVPVSIAAVLVLTMGAMVSMLRDTGERSLPDPSRMANRAPAAEPAPTVIADAGPLAAPRPAAPSPRTAAVAREVSPTASPSTAGARAERQEMGAEVAAAPASAPTLDAPAPAAKASAGPAAAMASANQSGDGDVAERKGAAASERPRAEVADAAPRAAPAAPGQAAGAARADPEAWLDRIRHLWEAGARDAAIQQGAEFRRSYPGFVVPKDFPVPMAPAAGVRDP